MNLPGSGQGSPDEDCGLTWAQFDEAVLVGIDAAVAPLNAALRESNGKLERWERALPWLVSGGVALTVTSFFLGFLAGSR